MTTIWLDLLSTQHNLQNTWKNSVNQHAVEMCLPAGKWSVQFYVHALAFKLPQNRLVWKHHALV